MISENNNNEKTRDAQTDENILRQIDIFKKGLEIFKTPYIMKDVLELLPKETRMSIKTS